MVLEDDNLLFGDDVIMNERDQLSSDLEVSVFDHHFGGKNGIVDPLTLLYNQVTELEEKVISFFLCLNIPSEFKLHVTFFEIAVKQRIKYEKVV